jgi:tetratricopeptide (TPR) repeat protein
MMIVFSRVPEPSSLLLTGDLNRVARTLLEQCDQYSSLDRPGAVDLLWQHAQSLDRQGDAEGFAVVSIRLAERYQACHRLGPALRCAEGAKEILSKWPHKQRKQNLAAALYASGLVHQCLGSYQEACAAYDEALTVLQEARKQWQSLGESTLDEQCRVVEGVIEELSTYVARAATRGEWGGIQFCHLMGYWLAVRKLPGVAQPSVSVSVEEAVIGMELELGAQRYRLEALWDGPDLRLVPPAAEGYVLLAVPRDKAEALGKAHTELEGATYVLVERGLRRGFLGPGIQWAEGEGLTWGEFGRDPVSGDIFFKSSYEGEPLRQPKFVGEDDLGPDTSGIIVGVFR